MYIHVSYIKCHNAWAEHKYNHAYELAYNTFVLCRPQTENPVIFIREAENSLEFGNQSFKLGELSL